MALRTSTDDVKSIMNTSLGDADILKVALHANLMVTRQLDGEGLTDALLKDIETWLTAHLISIGKERQVTNEKVGDIWITYNKNPEGYLKSTTFGQTVLFLDTSGKFAQSAKGRVKIRAIKQINT